jgi:hypothetical protein
MEITQIIGYTASTLLIISFILKDITKLRVMNSFGCAFFIAYGILLDWNWPIIIPNAFIIGVNIYHLLKDRRLKLNEE